MKFVETLYYVRVRHYLILYRGSYFSLKAMWSFSQILASLILSEEMFHVWTLITLWAII